MTPRKSPRPSWRPLGFSLFTWARSGTAATWKLWQSFGFIVRSLRCPQPTGEAIGRGPRWITSLATRAAREPSRNRYRPRAASMPTDHTSPRSELYLRFTVLVEAFRARDRSKLTKAIGHALQVCFGLVLRRLPVVHAVSIVGRHSAGRRASLWSETAAHSAAHMILDTPSAKYRL